MVMWDADAAAKLASLTSKEEKKALFNVIDKLRQLGERLVPPHMKPLKGGSGLRELRPRQGRTHVRAIYVHAGVRDPESLLEAGQSRLGTARRAHQFPRCKSRSIETSNACSATIFFKRLFSALDQIEGAGQPLYRPASLIGFSPQSSGRCSS
jgi:hypothetical protein